MRRRGLVTGLTVAGVLAWARPSRVVVAGESMRPTLAPGDRLLVVRPGRPGRGDVVVVRPPGRNLEMVKRVVGLPGDRVEVDPLGIAIDGEVRGEPWAAGGSPGGSWTLGPGEYLLMGDNRAASTDARSFGPVPASAIGGRVLLRYHPRPGIVR